MRGVRDLATLERVDQALGVQPLATWGVGAVEGGFPKDRLMETQAVNR